MILKGELEILASIALKKRTAKQITNYRIARYSSYINATLDSMIRRGYIRRNGLKEYQLTELGNRILLEYYPDLNTLNKMAHLKLLQEQADKVSEAIKLIEDLGTGYDSIFSSKHT